MGSLVLSGSGGSVEPSKIIICNVLFARVVCNKCSKKSSGPSILFIFAQSNNFPRASSSSRLLQAARGDPGRPQRGRAVVRAQHFW